ncbi:MAG: hypothetical protein ACKOUT_11230 [Novosphingobium sp.]
MTNHSSTFTRRQGLIGAAAGAGALLLPGSTLAQPVRTFRPEDFGARGDGRTNDTLAFAAMSQAVRQAGGGTIVLGRKTYRVGQQRPGNGRDFAFEPLDVIKLAGLPGPLEIAGNGAVLRTAAGQRFGGFERSGEQSRRKMPNYDRATQATPYIAMIWVENCRGPVTISGLELDGAIAEGRLGGFYGDTGRQIPMSGLFLRDNAGDEVVSDLYSHHHGLDGFIIDGIDRTTDRRRSIARIRSLHNGRQGCSVVGGRGYVFSDCTFGNTGSGTVTSAPGAGLDIEAEGGKVVERLQFSKCRFLDNIGAAMVADSGTSRNVAFADCEFVGTRSWSAWPSKPGYSFTRSSFIGALVRPWGDADPALATRFTDCTFRDTDPQGRYARPYLPSEAGGPILDAGGAQGGGLNVLLQGCRVTCTARGVLPWSTGVIFQDCTMSQTSPAASYPRGRYRGSNRITGNALIDGSRIEGSLVLNGRTVRG